MKETEGFQNVNHDRLTIIVDEFGAYNTIQNKETYFREGTFCDSFWLMSDPVFKFEKFKIEPQ